MKNSYIKNLFFYLFVVLNFILISCNRFDSKNKIAESAESAIAVYEADVFVSTIAGSEEGFADGLGVSAKFSSPAGIAVDNVGNIYVADMGNHSIRKIDKKGQVSTLAGSGSSGFYGGGFADGRGTSAKFRQPGDIAIDSSGNVYVADSGNCRVRKIDHRGNVSTLAGDGSKGFADGHGTSAKFYWPRGVAVDNSGNVYVADTGYSHLIRKIDSRGNVSSLARDKNKGFSDSIEDAVTFSYPVGLAVDKAGNIYVADMGNHRIKKIDRKELVSTLAGSGPTYYEGGGFADGQGALAKFAWPYGVAVDNSGNVYVADTDNHRIRKIDNKGNVSTLAGNGKEGFVDGSSSSAQFSNPIGIVVDNAGDVYVADMGNNRIRKITLRPSDKTNDD